MNPMKPPSPYSTIGAGAGTVANPALRWMIFLTLVVFGLFYVKWFPYYQRAFFAAAHHSIGSSILTGTAANPPPPSLHAALDYARTYGKAIWKALVLGLLVGSAIEVLIPSQWVARALGAAGFRNVAAAGLLAVPGMMCTCCAAPVVAGLRTRRAAPGAAIAFWIGNPMLNPATLVFLGFVLGWHWSLLRAAFGLLMVFGVGHLVNRFGGASAAASSAANAAIAGSEPIGSETIGAAPIAAAHHRTGFGTGFGTGSGTGSGNWLMQWARVALRMTVQLVPEYAVLVVLLGAARAWLFPHLGHGIGNELTWIVAFAAAGSLFVIPTAGEVPIVQAMLLLGVGAGPAAALLVTLPAISAPSMAMLVRSFPTRVLALVAVSVFALGVLASFTAMGLGF